MAMFFIFMILGPYLDYATATGVVHTQQAHHTKTTTSVTSHITIPVYARTVGISDVQFTQSYGGHIKLNGRELCYRPFSKTSGEALCRSKGLTFGFYNRTIMYDRYRSQLIHCSAPDLSYCYIFQRFCDEAVELHCTGYSTVPVATTTSQPTLVRLVNGETESEGRVELLHDGKWGTVCDDMFDKPDGDVICRMLGYQEASQTYKYAHFSNGYGPIWQDNLQCVGNETDIGDCHSNGWGNTDCGHGEDAGVACEPYEFGHGPVDHKTTVGNPCSLTSTPCKNGGTCVVGANYGYTCICPEGLGGLYCQNGMARTTTTKGVCPTNHCQNGGTCYQASSQSSYQCVCPQDFTGNNCETDASSASTVSVKCLDDAWNITVDLHPLRQKYPDFNANSCYMGMNNVTCKGSRNGDQLLFGQNFQTCRTKEKNLTEGVEYSNQLICALHDPLYHFIVTEVRLRANLLCKFFSVNKTSSIPKNRQVHLQYYSDPLLTRAKTFGTCRAGEKLYVRAYSDVRDSNIKMRLAHCYVTPEVINDYKMQYYIIRDGCVIDPNAVIFYQLDHESRFSFQFIDFSSVHGDLHLYCNATFCQQNDHSPACEPTCSSHVARSLRQHGVKLIDNETNRKEEKDKTVS